MGTITQKEEEKMEIQTVNNLLIDFAKRHPDIKIDQDAAFQNISCALMHIAKSLHDIETHLGINQK